MALRKLLGQFRTAPGCAVIGRSQNLQRDGNEVCWSCSRCVSSVHASGAIAARVCTATGEFACVMKPGRYEDGFDSPLPKSFFMMACETFVYMYVLDLYIYSFSTQAIPLNSINEHYLFFHLFRNLLCSKFLIDKPVRKQWRSTRKA
jgi:hypothetical protein